MTPDSRYITDTSLKQYFVDKTTGAPLAGGIVSFFKDTSRTTAKNVYTISGTPSNYFFTALPNPIVLSATGTIQDGSGNDVPLYYFPYDSTAPGANVELYYVTVTDSLGVPQFTREAWPGQGAETNPTDTKTNISNEISNSQFVDVLFSPAQSISISIPSAGTSTIPIAPDWNLQVTATGSATVTVTRNSIAGSAALPSNPPYTLTIGGGATISSLQLIQRLANNPSIWSPSASGDTNGYIAASLLLGPSTPTLTMSYKPSTGAEQVLLTASNASGVYVAAGQTIQLQPASNTDNASGYVDIIINLDPTSSSTISNIQVVGLDSNESGVAYDQIPANRQKDYLFHYYNPKLQYKAVPSALVGWDFPLNPAQFLGDTVTASGAANSSRYVWDQTIAFQTTASGLGFSRASTGALRLTAAVTTQGALVQYLSQTEARRLLNDRMAVNVSAVTNAIGGLAATVSLWYTTDASLPSTGSGNSLIATLDANGKPATFNGSWTEVPRSNLGNALFTIGSSATNNFNDYGFSGWDLQGATAVTTATYFAIVVGYASLPVTKIIDFNSISLCSGDIATRPALKTSDEHIRECQRYYEKSFDQGIVPASNVTVGKGEQTFGLTVATQFMGFIPYKVTKRATPTTILTYNPAAAGIEVRNITAGTDMTGTSVISIGQSGFSIKCNAVGAAGDTLGIHWTSDARLGL